MNNIKFPIKLNLVRGEGVEFEISVDKENINELFGPDGESILMITIRNELLTDEERIKTVEFLIKEGVDVNLKDTQFDCPPIIATIDIGDNNILELLLQNGADVNSTDLLGYSALMEACEWGNLKAIEILLDNKANPNLKNEDGETAFFIAQEVQNFQIVDYFLSKGVKE